jgi:hypothetical protein
MKRNDTTDLIARNHDMRSERPAFLLSVHHSLQKRDLSPNVNNLQGTQELRMYSEDKGEQCLRLRKLASAKTVATPRRLRFLNSGSASDMERLCHEALITIASDPDARGAESDP